MVSKGLFKQRFTEYFMSQNLMRRTQRKNNNIITVTGIILIQLDLINIVD